MVFCVFRRLAVRKIRVRRIVGSRKIGEGKLRLKLRPPGTAARAPGEVAAVRCASFRIGASPHIVAAHIKCVFGGEICNRYCALGLHYVRIVARNKTEVIVGIALQELCYRIGCGHAGIRKNIRYSWTDHYPELAAHQLAGVEPRLLRRFGIAKIDAYRRNFCRFAFSGQSDLAIGDERKRFRQIPRRRISPNVRSVLADKLKKRIIVDDTRNILKLEGCAIRATTVILCLQHRH